MMIFSIASVVLRLSSLHSWVFHFLLVILQMNTVESKSWGLYTLKFILLKLQNFLVWMKFAQINSQGGGPVHIIKWQMPQNSYPSPIRSEAGHDNPRIKIFNSSLKVFNTLRFSQLPMFVHTSQQVHLKLIFSKKGHW